MDTPPRSALDAPNRARSLRSPDAVAARRKLLFEPHVAPLTRFVDGLRQAHIGWEFPDFDPLDGGLNADLLFLFEKPGPMTSAGNKGSGFISRDNDDPTAEATFTFMREASIPRERTVTWNVVPGWNGKRRVTSAELKAGVETLKDLLPLLPKLHTIILVGLRAQRAKPLIESLGLRVLVSAHTSPLVRASQPGLWGAIPLSWSKVHVAT